MERLIRSIQKQVDPFIKAYTHRGLLSVVSSIFDPLGFAAPTLTIPKLWLRALKEQGWDEEISEEQRCWKKWMVSLGGVNRCEY